MCANRIHLRIPKKQENKMNGSGGDEVKQEYAVTPVSEIAGIVDDLRANFYETMPTSLDYRLQQLRQVLKMINENKKEIFNAFTEIFGGFGGKHYITRLYLIEVDVIDMINNLSKYMKEKVTCQQNNHKFMNCTQLYQEFFIIL